MQPAVTNKYPVTLVTRSPDRYDRVQVLLRILVLALVAALHLTVGAAFGTLYLLLPIAAAVLIARKERPGFFERDARFLNDVIDWVVAFYAYLLFVTDRFPLEARNRGVSVLVQPGAVPTPARALLRFLTSLPHALVLGIFGIACGLVALVSGFTVLFTERVPESLRAFQRDVLAWMARVLAYHASLVDRYPPFALGANDTALPGRDRTHAPG
jgi:hypothetical protein